MEFFRKKPLLGLEILNGVSLQCFFGEKKKWRQVLHPSNLLYTFPFLQERNEKKRHPISPITTKAS